MRVAYLVTLLLALAVPACAKKTPAVAAADDGPRITLEDVQRTQGGNRPFDRGVITLGRQDAVGGSAGEQGPAEPAADGAAPAEGGGEAGAPVDDAPPAGDDAVAEEGRIIGTDDSPTDETLGNDEGDEGI